MPSVYYNGKRFPTCVSVKEYITLTYPDNVLEKILDFLDKSYPDASPFIYNRRLRQLTTDEQYNQHKKILKRENKKYKGVSYGIKGIVDVLKHECSESKYENLNEKVNCIFDNDDNNQFDDDLAKIRYKKELIFLLKKDEEIPTEIRNQLKLNDRDIKTYGQYQNVKQKAYYERKKKNITPTTTTETSPENT